jgi:hypothetical protein
MRRGTKPRPVHQVAQQQPVPDADDEAGSEQERPIMERDQRRADRDERAGIRARSSLLRNVTTVRRLRMLGIW